jgi:Zn-dependent protease with chaperone function
LHWPVPWICGRQRPLQKDTRNARDSEHSMDERRRLIARGENLAANRLARLIRLAGRCVAVAGPALLAGCAVNPSTGRNQLIALPAAQIAHADLGFTLSAAAQGMAPSSACTQRAGDVGVAGTACPSAESVRRFTHQVRRMGIELTAEARIIAPELFSRIRGFDIRVENDIGAGSASSAGGRIAVDSSLAAINPTDDVVAFVLAREMGHVIARHGEEDSGAKMAFSALTAFIPGAMVVKFAASMVGAGVLRASWAEGQRREADELALLLLSGTGRPARVVALNLQSGMTHRHLPAGEWASYFSQSVSRVNAIALAAAAGQDVVPATFAATVVAAVVDVANETR